MASPDNNWSGRVGVLREHVTFLLMFGTVVEPLSVRSRFYKVLPGPVPRLSSKRGDEAGVQPCPYRRAVFLDGACAEFLM